MKKVLLGATALAMGSMSGCSAVSNEVAGNSANTGNALASGTVIRSDGMAAQAAIVRCRPDTLLPWANVPVEWNATTDSLGRWSCTGLPFGRIGIEARDPRSGQGAWRAFPEDSTHRRDTLAEPGTLSLAFPSRREGTVLLPGTSLAVPVAGDLEASVSGIPAGWKGSVLFLSATSGPHPDTLARNVSVAAGARDSLGYSRSSVLLRLSLGKAPGEVLTDVPLLLRLDASNLDFSRSALRGADLRVRTVQGTDLPVKVASWDSASAKAEVWTRLDALPAGRDSLDLVLACGLPLLPVTDSVIFPRTAGWAGSWAMELASGKVKDGSGTFDGTASGTSQVAGVVGKALRFDGTSGSFVRMEGSAGGALALPALGPYTLSAWVRLGDFATSRHVMGQGEYAGYLKFQKSWSADAVLDSNLWMSKDCQFVRGNNGGYYASAKADTARWVHLASVVSDSVVRLYVDGVLVDGGTRWDPDSLGRDASFDFHLGTAPVATGVGQNFLGEIDEPQVMSLARSAAWIRLQAWNQAPGSPRARKVR